MSDNYQAVYDAVRSKIHNCDVGDAVQSVIREANLSFYIERTFINIAEEAAITAAEQRRPCVLYRPALSIDGNQWCALYGEDLQSGIAGFGDTPHLAMLDFDNTWMNCKANPK
jgi:hypothetical protein